MTLVKHIAVLSIVLLSFGQNCFAENTQESTKEPAASASEAAPKVPAFVQESMASVTDSDLTTSTPSIKWSEGWYEGVSGYEKALDEYERTNKPMAVYVNVGWCPYCRKFENEILSNPRVVEAMKDSIKVRINPESSKRENAIAFQYGVMGFPSFYVHPPQPSGTVRLYTGVTPEQFTELYRKALK